ncbi:hypothetical protein [Nocardioides alkalitolerans]|uniref:divisome protein SepX/GlpR n=1 Tax=Nocardioides alkalitolerans TaxID=281714 RepID=UPI0004104A46|nr:hypothetical protein [Nocardioides alkalitolerans]
MDLSGVIFVAVAIAWAAYLIPKALKHHDEAVETRSVDRFSSTLRVLVRRGGAPEGGAADAVATLGAPATVDVPVAAPTPAQLRARRAAAHRAMQRRRRVLSVVGGLNVLGVLLAAFGVMPWAYVAAPVALLVTWLVTCRVMVKGERAALVRPVAVPAPATKRRDEPINAASPEEDITVPAGEIDHEGLLAVTASADTSVITAVDAELLDVRTIKDDRDPATLWNPVDVPLPTYVGKDHAAARELPAFDFDDTGVWTSGRDESDSDLVRRTAASRDERDSGEGEARRVVGH